MNVVAANPDALKPLLSVPVRLALATGVVLLITWVWTATGRVSHQVVQASVSAPTVNVARVTLPPVQIVASRDTAPTKSASGRAAI